MNISRLSIAKFLELVLTIVCVVLHYYSYNPEADIGMVVTGTFIGFLIIFAGAAAGYLMNTPTHKRVDIFYSCIGVILFVTSGALIIDRYKNYSRGEYKDKNMAKASLAIINAVVLGADAFFTQRGG